MMPTLKLKAAMIFAAGFGTRMGALTAQRPKALLPLGGETLLDRAIKDVRALGIERIVVNAHAHADQIVSHLSKHAPDVEVIVEAPMILETGGGLRAALPHLWPDAGEKGPVLTLNPDVLWVEGSPLPALLAAWERLPLSRGEAGGAALLTLVAREKARACQSAGDFFCAPGGGLTRRGLAVAAPYVYGGAQILHPNGIEDIPEASFSLNRLWDGMLAAGQLYGHAYTGSWVDVGTPLGLREAERALEEQRR